MSTYVTELKLSIYKILKEANKWYREDYLEVGKLYADPVRGLVPVWGPVKDSQIIRLEGEVYNACVITHPIKSGELFLTDLTFHVAPEAVDEAEVLEHMLVGLVRLYTQFKEKVNALQA